MTSESVIAIQGRLEESSAYVVNNITHHQCTHLCTYQLLHTDNTDYSVLKQQQWLIYFTVHTVLTDPLR